jgi:alkylated DNA nucleotide flippase Atl1
MPQVDSEQRNKLLRAFIALYDGHLLTQGQAAELAGLSRVAFDDVFNR